MGGLNSAQLKQGLATSANISIQGSATRVRVAKDTMLPYVSTESFKPTPALGDMPVSPSSFLFKF